MNLRLLARILGILLAIEAAVMVGCGAFAWLDRGGAGEREAMQALWRAGGIAGAFAAALALAGWREPVDRIPRREAVVIAGLSWLLWGAFGALPYVHCPPGLTLWGGFFEAVSGFTTTGSTVIRDLEQWPRGLILWRAVTQWLGGIGILVLLVALLSYIGGGSKSLFRSESSFQSGESTMSRIRDTALLLWKIYLFLGVACALGLRWMGMTWFNAVAHACTAVSTGGFSPHNDSIARYSGWGNGWLIELWLALFMAACSLNFLVYVVLIHRRWSRLRCEEDGWWFLGICLACAVSIAAGVAAQDPAAGWWQALRDAVFVVVSIASTTGFGTADYERWPAFAQALLAVLMIVGGCSGSTAGGMKVGRLLVLLKSAGHELVRAFRPSQFFRLTVNGNGLDEAARSRILLFVAMYCTIVALAAVLVAGLEFGTGVSLETCLGSVLATLSNIGPGFGTVGPTENFAHLRAPTQVFLALLMVLGRLELFALLVLFVPAAWRRY